MEHIAAFDLVVAANHIKESRVVTKKEIVRTISEETGLTHSYQVIQDPGLVAQ